MHKLFVIILLVVLIPAAAFGQAAGGGNFGGGIQYWPKDHVGLRFEVRDHVFSSDRPHLFTFRVGVTFR